MNKLTYEQRAEIYGKAIDTFGVDLQLSVAMEEMAELTKELCKAVRGIADPVKVAEELADATIMLEQLRLIFGNNECVCAFMDSKVLRLLRRVEDAQEKSGAVH